jgi:chromate reductase
MATIVAISGSLRVRSFNSMLLRAAVEVAPAGVSVVAASIAEVPLYNADVEAAGMPAPVAALKEEVAGCDGLLLVTPEYNNSIPGVFKNAIDWLSRPPADLPRVFGGCPVGIIGATPGKGATLLSQAAWLPILRTLGTLPYFGGRVAIAQAGHLFDAEGHLTDAASRGQLTSYMSGFAAFVTRYARPRPR